MAGSRQVDIGDCPRGQRRRFHVCPWRSSRSWGAPCNGSFGDA